MASLSRPKGPRLVSLEIVEPLQSVDAFGSGRPCEVVGVVRSARTPSGEIARVMRDGSGRICAIFIARDLIEIGDGVVTSISGRLLAEERGVVVVAASHFERCDDLDDDWQDYATTMLVGDGGYLLEAR